VEDGVNGLVCPPEPRVLAAALRWLMEDQGLAERMGEAGHARVSAMSWRAAVEKLVLV